MTQVTIGYGMTETSPLATQTQADDSLDVRVSTVGRAHPHVEIQIADPATGERVPYGTPGEFRTRGYSVMLGYWDQPEQTAEAIDEAGWMHTSDLATMDADGYVNITGRIKDMLIRGGENIYPREIEELLFTIPTSSMPTSSACRIPSTARRSWPGSSCGLEPVSSQSAMCEHSPGPPGGIQAAPQHPARRRVPHDGERQGPQGGDAPALARPARPRRTPGWTTRHPWKSPTNTSKTSHSPREPANVAVREGVTPPPGAVTFRRG